jgi:hypothetical protein
MHRSKGVNESRPNRCFNPRRRHRGYIAARIDVAVQGPCVGTPSGSAECIPPDPTPTGLSLSA